MNKIIKFLKSSSSLRYIIVCSLIFCGCSATRYGQAVFKQKKWISWEVNFKKNVTEKQKINVLTEIDKYILSYLDSSEIKIFSIKFNHIYNSEKNSVVVFVDRTTLAAVGSRAPTPPPGPGPHFPAPFTIQFWEFVNEIRVYTKDNNKF